MVMLGLRVGKEDAEEGMELHLVDESQVNLEGGWADSW